MGERKVVNKYIPADFDPSLVPRGKKLSSKDGTVPVRMMLPFSIQCNTCREFLYRGRKFNSKKERMGGPDGVYLGITRWRFYIKCTQCARPITFCTDPKNADYEMESGGTRNYEVYKDKEKTEQEALEEEEKEKKEDPMKALENRALESQREMAEMDHLEQIKAMNAQHVKLIGGGEGFDATALAVLGAQDTVEKGTTVFASLTEEDEALVKSIQFGNKQQQTIKRLDEQDEAEMERKRKQQLALFSETKTGDVPPPTNKPKLPVLAVVKRRRIVDVPTTTATTTTTSISSDNSVPAAPVVVETQGNNALAGLLGGYGSDSDSD